MRALPRACAHYGAPPLPPQALPADLLAALPPMGGGAAPPPTMAPMAPMGLPGAPSGLPVAPSAPPPPPQPPPTKLIKLEGMLTQEILDDPSEFKEVVEDIKEECGKHGTVVSCVVPTATELQGREPTDVGSCFVTYELLSSAATELHRSPMLSHDLPLISHDLRYELLSSAAKAHADLNGRSFDGQTVKVSFLTE